MPSIIEKQLEFVQGWPGIPVQGCPLLRVLNSDGNDLPLVWCFQNVQEFKALAEALGPDRPLYGLRSGHLLMDYTEENIVLLASTYSQQISQLMNILDVEPALVCLGGNCQGAGLMLYTAKYLEQETSQRFQLVLLESTLPVSVRSRVKLIFGRQSSYNPYRRFSHPHAGLAGYYDQFSVHIIPGTHGEFFKPEWISQLARAITTDEFLIEKHDLNAIADCPPTDGIRVELTGVKGPIQMSPRTRVRVPLSIHNDTGQDLHCAGLHIANHWLNAENGSVYQWLDWNIPCPDLPAGRSIAVYADILAPFNSGSFMVQFELVKEGVQWLTQPEGKHAVMGVEVLSSADGELFANVKICTDTALHDLKLQDDFQIGRVDSILLALKQHTCFASHSILLAAQALAESKRLTESTALYRLLLTHDTRHKEAIIGLLQNLVAAQDYAGAEEVYAHYASDHGRSCPTMNKFWLIARIALGKVSDLKFLALVKLEQDHKASVLKFFFAHAANHPRRKMLQLQIAEALVKIQPSTDAYLKLTGLLNRYQAYAQLEQVLFDARARFPVNHVFCFRLAQVTALLHGEEAAIPLYEETIRLFGLHREAYQKLITYYQSHDPVRGRYYLDKAVRLFPDDVVWPYKTLAS